MEWQLALLMIAVEHLLLLIFWVDLCLVKEIQFVLYQAAASWT
jgi:hypothetical protein